MCTDGTLKTQLYQKACAHHKIDVMIPSENLQKRYEWDICGESRKIK